MNKRKAWTVSNQNITHSAAGASTSAGMLLNEMPLMVLTCLAVCASLAVAVWAFPRFQSSSNVRCCGFRTVKWVDGWVEWVHSDEKLPNASYDCWIMWGPLPSLAFSRSCSRSRAMGRVEMVWKGKWRLVLWLFWHTSQALTAQFSAQVIPVQNNRIWLWLHINFSSTALIG